jgi:ABC-type transport system involved in multi-copper enzyme maturation permease subunit
MMADVSPNWLIASQSARFVLRERTVALLAGLFVALVLISAWLGWSATSTVDYIYADAAAFLKAAGQPVPSNPVLDISPLSLMRNMSVYVALIGALSAIVIGNRLVGIDRKAGVLPLIGIRPMRRSAYADGKIAALLGLVLALICVAAVMAVATFLLLPTVSLTGPQWLQLAGFLGVSAFYMAFFGLIALASAAWAKSETVGLLLPVTLWLTLTFILPQLTANLNPTAAINPISALAAPPDTSFFHWAARLLGPLSLADAYKFASANLLDYLPQAMTSPSFIPPVANIALATAAAAFVAWRALTGLAMTQGDYDV